MRTECILPTIALMTLAWTLTCPGLTAGDEIATRPNIVFFLTDDQNHTTLGCAGDSVMQTPNIDALAKSGTRFSQATVSHSICWVSRTTLMTGLTGRTYGQPGNRELARAEAVEMLVSDHLRNAGYRTGYFGKWHAKMPKGFVREDHFDEFEAISRNPYYKKQTDGSVVHETDLIIDRGIEFLRNQTSDQPFALNLWFNAGHAEDGDRRPGVGHFSCPNPNSDQYAEHVFDRPIVDDVESFDALPDFLKTTINRERYFWRWDTPRKYQTNMRAYYRMISGIDAGIGRFMDTLRAKGLDKNTIIIYSADNGYYMGNRGLAGKWSHFEESIRVPMIIADLRNDKASSTSEALVQNLDIPATMLDYAGINVPEAYQGSSLRGLVEKTEDDRAFREATFHEHFAVRNRIPAWEGVRTHQAKYAKYVDDDYEFLHDLESDTNELVNLARTEEASGLLESMRSRTQGFLNNYGGSLHPPSQSFSKSTEPHPEAAAAVTAPVRKDGWHRLFDGKSLRGWTGDAKYWSVEDGAITGVADGTLKRNHFICWKGNTVQNFELKIKVKLTAGGNSGIQYRGRMRPDIGLDSVSGYQCDVVANVPEYNGMLYQ
ncbi:MAG: sulfatase-like hydrolase/transferase, partial [Planctomycetota bacterium]